MHTRRSRSRTPPLTQAKQVIIGGIKAVAESPWTKFTTGVVLLTSGLDEAAETLFADLSALELGAHHGVMVLGFVNLLSSLPDMLEGLVGTFLVDEQNTSEADAGAVIPADDTTVHTETQKMDHIGHPRRAA